MDRFSFLNAIHAEFIDELYQKYQKFPDSIDPSWRSFFQGFDFASSGYSGEVFVANGNAAELPEEMQKEFKVINLIDAYRSRGHLFTKTNPVRERRKYAPDLSIENFELTSSDLDKTFKAGEVLGLGGERTLREIINHLEKIYCNSIGIEYMYIRKPEMRKWIQEWINANINQPKLSEEEKRSTLRKLNYAVAFESFLHTKFVGQKRFSLEGNESLIPALDSLIERSADHGVQEFVVGMAHRGRLNVLANIFGKSYSQIFSEFESKDFEEEELFAGDVKYHLGSTSFSETYKGKKVKLNLAPNPSHLETVDPIVEGISRAKVDLDYKGDYSKIMPILIHGDAAIAGQGIVYEVIQMMSLDGYKTGGTVHIVVNNQIGFTTNYHDARSSTYCTDVGKVTLSPVLHVNADDVESVVHAMHFAADFRKKWGRDVFIDLLGYRKYGHNEGDEPRFTQPKLYKAISKHPNPRDIYKEKLMAEGVVGESIVKEIEKEFKSLLEKDFDASKEIEKNSLDPFMPEEWKGFSIPAQEEMLKDFDTSFSIDKLKDITHSLTTLPEDKKFIRKIERLLKQRKEMVENDKIDWGMAELLAYGSLMQDGHNIRLSGEDVERGTFSHRHAVIKTEDAGEIVLLNSMPGVDAKFEAYNSLLSEYAVLGYDYGYALAAPNTLTIWEAQFGDFSNGAQIVIDQYISAAEDKWLMQNGLVMLLPHGYEGQGAEHSSARLERYLQLCADGNMIIANCTTPANFYHLLRRQMKTNYRKPLIVFTPKSLLRHPKVISSLQELAKGSFEPIIDDSQVAATKVKRVVCCSGKLYYDLLAERESNRNEEVALVRFEQLYPIDFEKFDSVMANYPKDVELVWAQEEPENMGAWGFVLRKFRKYPFDLIAPPESGAPAPGSGHRHKIIHQRVINSVFDLKKNKN